MLTYRGQPKGSYGSQKHGSSFRRGFSGGKAKNTINNNRSQFTTLQFSEDQIEQGRKIIEKEWENYARQKFSNNPKILSIELVGSRAKGTARPDSDADFKIILDKLPTRVYINPKTGEKTDLVVDVNSQSVDFQNEVLRDVDIDGVPVDAFFELKSFEGYWARNRQDRK